MLALNSPLQLLEFASGLIESCSQRPGDRLRMDEPAVAIDDLLLRFIDSGCPELVALAHASLALRPDRRIQLELDRAGLPYGAPAWLRTIADIRVDDVQIHGHALGDGENIVIGWHWPDGEHATLLTYVDHSMGTVVKDAFAVPESLDSLHATYEAALEEGMFIEPLGQADAKVRLVEALDVYDMTLDMPESETWPMVRPLLDWVVGRLPGGGVGYVRPNWPEQKQQELADDFLASEHSRIPDLSTEQVELLLNPLVWFGCDYGPGDPLRWSPVAVEIVLADWYRRKVIGLPSELVRRLPEVLAGFIRYSHQRRNVPASLTTETLEAVEQWAPALLDQEPTAEFDLQTEDLVITLEAELIDLVGGAENYIGLDETPLPDRPLDWLSIPDDLRKPTADTLAYLDRWALELFDVEVRTMARAVLAQVVATDPATFKRSANTAGLAAAILAFLMKRLTGRLTGPEAEALQWKALTYKALAAETGISPSSISSRAKTIGNVLDRSTIDWTSILHSSQRREILDSKATIEAWRNQDR